MLENDVKCKLMPTNMIEIGLYFWQHSKHSLA